MSFRTAISGWVFALRIRDIFQLRRSRVSLSKVEKVSLAWKGGKLVQNYFRPFLWISPAIADAPPSSAWIACS
jgi:hypothetical protein